MEPKVFCAEFAPSSVPFAARVLLGSTQDNELNQLCEKFGKISSTTNIVKMYLTDRPLDLANGQFGLTGLPDQERSIS